MNNDEYINIFNYIEIIYELTRNQNSIEHLVFEDIEDAYYFCDGRHVQIIKP